MPTPEQTKETIRKINWTYFKGIFGAFILVTLSYYIAHWMNSLELSLLNHENIKRIQLFSIALAAAAIYGKKALEEIMTAGEKSKEEKYNNLLFTILASIGFFLSVLGLQLQATQKLQIEQGKTGSGYLNAKYQTRLPVPT